MSLNLKTVSSDGIIILRSREYQKILQAQNSKIFKWKSPKLFADHIRNSIVQMAKCVKFSFAATTLTNQVFNESNDLNGGVI